jgi:hypothetical protein
MTGEIIINSYWGPRPERPAELAGRCRQLLDRLASISPHFSNWSFVGRAPSSVAGQYKGPDGVADFFRDQYRTVALEYLSGGGLADLIDAGVCRDSDDSPVPLSGYLFGAFTGSGRDAQSVSLNAHVGNSLPDNYYINSIQIKTPQLPHRQHPAFTLQTLIAMMLAVTHFWDTTWAAICPDDLLTLWPPSYMTRRASFNLAWVTYLSPRFAPMVTPPRSAIVEHTPEGGLVMTATRDRFDVANPAHLAVARDIESAMAPVNALPWPPDAAPEK